MWACWIHAQASLVTAGKFEGKYCRSMIMNVDGKLPNSTKKLNWIYIMRVSHLVSSCPIL